MYKIMVVDDEAAITTQLEESMTSMGFEVVGSAYSGQEALDMARALSPDLILMDIVMPGTLDGIDASINIKAELDIPIIFLTAYADDEFIMRAKNVEPFGYILKPFQEREIKASIEIGLYKKELERRLRASEEQFRTIVDTASSLLIVTDANNNNVYVSPNCHRITGYTREELQVGGILWAHEDNMPKVKEVFERPFCEGAEGGNFGYKAVKKNGKLWYASTSWDMLRNKKGELKGIVFQTIDITREKQAAMEIKKEKDFSANVMATIPDSLLVLDKDLRIKAANRSFYKTFLIEPEKAIGSSIAEILGDKDGRLSAELTKLFGTEAILENFELHYKFEMPGERTCPPCPPSSEQERRTGESATRRERIFNITAKGMLFVEEELIVLQDITELKQAKKKLKAKEKELLHAGRLSSLGEIAVGVAHEINQPLSVISMATEGALRDIEKSLFDVSGLSRDLEDIMKNVGRIDRIITHMRRFTRKSGEWKLVEPEEALNNAFILLGEHLKMHDISVYRKIEDNLPLIELDVNQLEQVFVNILINAEQVLDDRGEEAKKSGEDFEKKLVCGISRKKENEHEWVMFEFADNAYGVPDELKRKIFEPFFTTKEAGKGTGLGLSIAYDIVTRSLGGRILVEDNDMGGASLKVAVPVKKRTEDRGQRAEDRGQRTEDRG